MRKTIILVILVALCCATGNAQIEQMGKAEKLNQKEIQTQDKKPISLQYAEKRENSYSDSDFVKEYLLSNEIPIDLPKRINYTNAQVYRIALREWAIENPRLVKKDLRHKFK